MSSRIYAQHDSPSWLVMSCSEEINFIDNMVVKIDSEAALKAILSEVRMDAYNASFIGFSIDSTYIDGDSVMVGFHRGKAYKIEQYIISIVNADSVEIDNNLRQLSPTSLISMQGVQRKVIARYENNGYPFATIVLDSIVPGDTHMLAYLKLDPGKYYQIDSLIVKSDTPINERILWNRIGVKKNDEYDESKIIRIAQNLGEISYLTMERSPEIIFTDKTAFLYLYLKKKPQNRVNGLIGFQPAEDGSIEFTGNFELGLTNALGADEAFEFEWKKLSGQSQDLKLGFNYPYILNYNIGLEQNLNIYKNDTTYTEVKSKTAVQYLFGRNSYMQVFVQSSTYNSLLASAVGESNPESKLVQYGLGAQLENLDYRLNPRKGIEIRLDVAIGEKKSSGISSDASLETSEQLTVEGFFSKYVPIAKRGVIKSSINFAQIRNDKIVDKELYRIGGINSIRGFDEQVFGASGYVIGGVEYRYLTDVNSYFSAFIDYGIIEKKVFDANIELGNALGFGLGAAFETKSGIFSLSYALGSFNDTPIILRTGKIHFGFNALF